MSNKEIGHRIKMIRKEKGLTLEEFGSLMSPTANKSNVSRWESGKAIPNNARLKMIAELGNITVEELLYGDDRNFVNSLIVDIAKKYYNLDISFDEEFQDMIYNRIQLSTNVYSTSADELYIQQKDFFDTWLLYPPHWDEEGMIMFAGNQISLVKKELTNAFLKDSNIFSKQEKPMCTYNKIIDILNKTYDEIEAIEIDPDNTFHARLNKEIEENANSVILEPSHYDESKNN